MNQDRTAPHGRVVDLGWTFDDCFACGRLVLGLEGQDQRLDRFLLAEGDDALAAGAFGRAHTLCLRRSGWGPRWRKLRLGALTAREAHRLVHDADGVSLVRDSAAAESHVLDPDGGYDRIADAAWAARERVAGGFLLPVRERVAWNLRDFGLLAAEAWGRLRSAGRCPLLDLLRSLDLYDRLQHPFALEGGDIHYLPDEDVLQEDPTSGLAADVFYRRFLSDAAAAALSASL